MLDALRKHWPEYLIEAAGLALFMISAALFATIIEHPASPIRQVLPDPFVRRLPMGIAMGLTAIAIIYSPWGQQSGAHINPAVTLTFFRLGKIAGWDAVFYILSQCLGGVTGLLIASAFLHPYVADSAVNYVVTVPGTSGTAVAFSAELLISAFLMGMVLTATNHPRWARHTGLFAGCLVSTFITIEAPLSGMSMNPARSLASAVPAGLWTSFWIYVTAPLIGMFIAAELFLLAKGQGTIKCAKLHHANSKRCIFRCGYHMSN